ncbi:hypothetical protein U14_01734 [Candidatus Moduliflexus flocculans]|uniref:TIR domain-containing protein n=1 Tax=Candidatus Moduliflexus flocculans TaxID=1499966 RepID=A0A0S6VSZ6_9BACT|nr:hypothetical protein U14_01734 [Candidatus Moduliflexus flocculans]
MSEQKAIPITKEQPLTLELPDATCRLTLRYEENSHSEKSISESKGNSIKPGGMQVRRYGGKYPEKEPAINFDKKPTGSSPSTEKLKIFVSYNTNDFPEVEQIIQKLKEHNQIKAWIDIEQIEPGDLIRKVLQQAILESICVLIFIGTDIGRWQEIEIDLSIQQGVEEQLHLIPVLLPGIDNIPQDLSVLKRWNYVSLKSMYDDNALKRLIRGIMKSKSR